MNIPCDAITKCPVGISIDPILIMPGDFILTTKDGFYHRLIQFGQSLRFTPELARFTHCALVINKQGDLIEADSPVIKITNLSDYQQKDYSYVHIKASPEDRAEEIAFAKSCLGEAYGWVTILSVGLSMLTGLRFSFGFDPQAICSGLVARSLERTSAIFSKDPSHISPADLASFYGI